MLITVLSLVFVWPSVAETVELLRDPHFANGIRVATRANYPDELKEAARARWLKAFPATADAAWEFIEIAELQNLGDNPDTPQVKGPHLIYASRDHSKRCEVNTETGDLRLVINTEREWRGGCNLSGLQDGIEPRFCRGKAWNWPHFLLAQFLRDPHNPDRPLFLADYPDLTLSLWAELTSCAMGQPNPCPPGSWGDHEVGNHCLLYVAFVMIHRDPQVVAAPDDPAARIIYALYPLFCSWDGNTHSSPEPWLGLDPAGHAVYWTPNHDGLVLGQRKEVALEVGELCREAVAELNRRYNLALSPSDYAINEMLLGWEIWGPFHCDVAMGGLSLRSLTAKREHTGRSDGQ